ncbi:DUF4133 domain-containing protein [Dysgonomonas capnocytophagoides]|uniref:DUF4133 domain-containing protein n=1 Tax=Dysgonomonas capnocytophagoides TaxID=45254 RepID=A0A4Y8LAL4_9BACT|nr:DUF4133 domain-containing protein [Dysgonomonas capnocytophagoides]TFD99088.1 DUF4133 domain-containing protein [Dysgonomonas capnocytophagoides]
MAEYSINKGIGKPAEFKGLKSQYLFIFAGGLLGVFIVFVIMYMIGINQMFCIGFGVITAGTLVWGTFYLNDKYGEHGLMKLQAMRNHPRYIINRRRMIQLISRIKRKGESA